MTHNDASDGGTTAVVVGTRATRAAGTAIGGRRGGASTKSKSNNNIICIHDTKIIHGTKTIKQVCRDPIRGWIVEYVDGDKKDVTYNEVVDLFSSYEATFVVARLVAEEEQRKLFEAAAAAEADWVEVEAAKLASQQLAKEQEEVARLLAAVEEESARQLAEKEQERARQKEEEAARLLAAMEEEAQKQRVAKAEAAQQLVTKQEEATKLDAVEEEEHTGPGRGGGKTKQVPPREQPIANKRERERTQHSFDDNDKLQKQPLRQLQEKKKKQNKTITNRKKSEKDNNDEIMMKVSSPLASMAPSESDESESVSVSTSELQVPATTVVVLPASTLLVHTENATTPRTVAASASASLLSLPPLTGLTTTDSPRRMMNGSGTPDTTRTAVLQVAPVASISDPLVQPRLSASASATINVSFRFQGNDKTRFNHLFNAELEDIHKKNNEMNSETFTGIAAKMNCDMQKVMYHFYNSGREHEIKKGYL